MLGSMVGKAKHKGEALTGTTVDEWIGKLKDDMLLVTDETRKRLQEQMDTALAMSDDRRINSLLDGAMAANILGSQAPKAWQNAAKAYGSRQLREAIASEDPKRLKGALVAARRLHATDVPEFEEAVAKYHQVRKLPEGWDVSNMVLSRQGSKIVAKKEVTDPAIHTKFQWLLDHTHRAVYTRDRMGQAVPERLALVSVRAVENDELWGEYMARREALRQELAADASDFVPYQVDTMDTEEGGDPAESAAQSLAQGFATPLLPEVNEVLLFHGTSTEAASKITTGNFKINLAGSNAGTLYGRGIYMAENGSKADEYTQPNANDERYMLVSRVLLGRVFYTDTKDTDPRACEDACLKGKFHSVLGDRKKCRDTFREFIVFDEEQVYSNWVLTYKRVFSKDVRIMQVPVPARAVPGTFVQVTTPEGKTVEARVPLGAVPGKKFSVQY